MAELITVGEKGQIVIPKKMRDDLKIVKGTKLLIKSSNGTIVINPITLDEKHMLLLASELSLKKTWDNPSDDRWDDVL